MHNSQKGQEKTVHGRQRKKKDSSHTYTRIQCVSSKRSSEAVADSTVLFMRERESVPLFICSVVEGTYTNGFLSLFFSLLFFFSINKTSASCTLAQTTEKNTHLERKRKNSYFMCARLLWKRTPSRKWKHHKALQSWAFLHQCVPQLRQKKKRKNNMPFLALHVSHRFFSFITNIGAQVRLYGRRNVVFSFAHYSFSPPLVVCLFFVPFLDVHTNLLLHPLFFRCTASPAQRAAVARCTAKEMSAARKVQTSKCKRSKKNWQIKDLKREKKKNEDYDGHVSLRVKALGSPVQSVRRRPCPLLTSRRLLALFLKKKERFCVYAVSLLLPRTFRPP